MTTEELHEKRNTLAGEIRQLADAFEANGNEWKGGQKSKWAQVNDAYDKVVAEIEEADEVTGRLNQINGDGDSAPGVSIGRDDAKVGWQGGRQTIGGNGRSLNGSKGGMQFRNAATGERIQALAPTDRLVSERAGSQAALAGVEVGDVVQSMLLGEPRNMSRAAYNSALGGVDTQGGYILNPTLSGQVIDLARDASVVMRAGAQTLPMPSRELQLMSITSDPTAHWREEGVEIPSSGMTFGLLTLQAKLIGAIVPVTIEMLEDSANAGQIITGAIQDAMAVEIDRVALMGTGAASEPRGIRNAEGIQTVSGIGTPDDYSDVSSAVGKIMGAKYNGDPSSLSWVAHPRDLETYDGLTDTTGQPLNPTPWAGSLRRYATTSLPTDDDGDGSNKSIGLVGDFSQVVVGMRTTGVNIRIGTDGTASDPDGTEHNLTSQLKRAIVAYTRLDVAVLRPSWMAELSGITTS